MSTTEVGEIAGGESGDGVCSEMELTVRRLKVRREDTNLCPSTTHQNPSLLFRVTGDLERRSLVSWLNLRTFVYVASLLEVFLQILRRGVFGPIGL